MSDPLRETRTMVLASIPYPPLPIEVDAVEANANQVTGEKKTISSHDIIAQCLNAAVLRNDQGDNATRRANQENTIREFLFTLANEGFEAEAEKMYDIYCKFTHKHIMTYTKRDPQIRFQPFSYVSKGDPIHAKMAEYMAGQSIVFEDSPIVPRSEYLKKSYGSLLLMARDRWGHVATEEEREIIAQKENEESRPA